MASAFRLRDSIFLSALDSQAKALTDRIHESLGGIGVKDIARDDLVHGYGGPSWAEPNTTQILVATVPRPDMEQRAHKMSRIDGSITIPVVLEYPMVRVGPVADGDSGCYECFSRRLIQHGADETFETMKRQAFAATEGGPNLLLHHESEYVVARVLSLVYMSRSAGSAGQGLGGRSMWLDVANFTGSVDRVVGIHGCATCGGQAGTPEERTWKFLT